MKMMVNYEGLMQEAEKDWRRKQHSRKETWFSGCEDPTAEEAELDGSSREWFRVNTSIASRRLSMNFLCPRGYSSIWLARITKNKFKRRRRAKWTKLNEHHRIPTCAILQYISQLGPDSLEIWKQLETSRSRENLGYLWRKWALIQFSTDVR